MHLRTDTSSQSHFARVPTISRKRNSFSVAEKHVTTIQFDQLTPVWHKFIYPGDTFSGALGALARLNTQITTLYDDLYIDLHAWFVPLRLLQINFARFQFNAQPAGPSQDNSALTTPKIDLATLGSAGFLPKSLYDYLGYPTNIDYTLSAQHINNYLGRAYNLIWNENYRDQNLQNPVVVDLDDGPDLASDYQIKARGKRHDMLTSNLTAQQKGPASTISFSGVTAPVTGAAKVFGDLTNIPTWLAPSGGTARQLVRTTASTAVTWDSSPDGTTGSAKWGDPHLEINQSRSPSDFTLSASLASVSFTVNQLRQSVAVQHLLEADARGGTRDVESIQHRWGVTVPDFRIQRPEWIGGQTFSFDGHIVPQTSASSEDGTPQANLTQFSQALNSFRLTHSFVEHGIFMILISARSNITYQQGLQRELSYKTRFDFYQPEFSNLGEVAVKNKEIFAQGTSADENTFGFQEYGYELRYGRNKVTAEMRSNYDYSLDSKHMADDYGSLPSLGNAWIQSNTPISRNIVVDTSVSDPIELNMLAQGTMSRTLPMYSVPGLNRL